MMIFESFEQLQYLKDRVSNNEHFFIIVDTFEDAREVENLIMKHLGFKRYNNSDNISSVDFDDPNQLVRVEVCFRNSIVYISNVNKKVLDDDYEHKLMFPLWIQDEDEILQSLGIDLRPRYKPRQFIRESVEDMLTKYKDRRKSELSIVVKTKEDAFELRNFLENNNFQFNGEFESFDKDLIEEWDFTDRYNILTFYLHYILNSDNHFYGYWVIAPVELDDPYNDDRIVYYPEDRNLIRQVFQQGPTYQPRQFIYEGKLENLKQSIINEKGIFIVPEDKKSLQEVINVLKDMDMEIFSGFNIDLAMSFSFGQGRTFMFFIINNLEEPQYGFVEVEDEEYEKTMENLKDSIIFYPQEKNLLRAIYNLMPTYKPRQFIRESKDNERVGIRCDNRNRCVDFEEYLHKIGWVYRNGSKYVVRNGDFPRLLFHSFNKEEKKFTAKRGLNSNDLCDVIYDYPQDKLEIEKHFNPYPNYSPKKFIRESNQQKVLHAFDMDDTLVFSKRFEEHIRPMLIREYLTPEIILNNKLDDIDIGIEQLKYENGRIYFDDPNKNYKIPKGSSWVRKKGRIYIIQPDAYFMTEESMPIGTHDDIVKLYNESEYRCIITARNERLRSQTVKVLKDLGLEKPNVGLFMYPVNSFSFTYEYKSNKLLEIQSLYNFDEIHYYDDNIKLLKKMKENLKGKDIPITFYKVTKNRYRQL